MALIDLITTQNYFKQRFQTKPLVELLNDKPINNIQNVDITSIDSKFDIDTTQQTNNFTDTNASGFTTNQKTTNYKYDTSNFVWVGDEPDSIDFFKNNNAKGFTTFAVNKITDYNLLSSDFAWKTDEPPVVDFFNNFNAVGFDSFATEYQTYFNENTSKFVWKSNDIPSTDFFANTNADGFTIFPKPKETKYKTDTSDFVWKSNDIPSTDFFDNFNATGFTIFANPMETEYIQDTSLYVWAANNISNVDFFSNFNATGFTIYPIFKNTEYIQDTSDYVWKANNIPSVNFIVNTNATGFTLFGKSLETEYIDNTSKFVWQGMDIPTTNSFIDDDATGFTLFSLLKETNFIMDTSDYVWKSNDIPSTDFFLNINADGFTIYSPLLTSYYKDDTSLYVWKADDIPFSNSFIDDDAFGFTLFSLLKETNFIMDTSDYVWKADNIPSTDSFLNTNATGFTIYPIFKNTEYIQDTSVFVWKADDIPSVDFFLNTNATGFTIYGKLKSTEYIMDTSEFVWKGLIPNSVNFFLDTNATGFTIYPVFKQTEYIMDTSEFVWKGMIPNSVNFFADVNATGFTIYGKLKITEYIMDTSIFVWKGDDIPAVNWFPNTNATGFTLFAPPLITEYIMDTSIFVWKGMIPNSVNFFADVNATGFTIFNVIKQTEYIMDTSEFVWKANNMVPVDWFSNKYSKGFIPYKIPKSTDFILSDKNLKEQYSKFNLRDTSHQNDWMQQPYILRGIQLDGEPNRYGFDKSYLYERLSPYIDRSATHAYRITKYMGSAKGILNTIRQVGMQLMNSTVETPSDGFGLIENIFNIRSTQIYNPLSTILSSGGMRIQRHGLELPFEKHKNYEYIVNKRNVTSQGKNLSQVDTSLVIGEQGTDNRLLMLTKELFPHHYSVRDSYLNASDVYDKTLSKISNLITWIATGKDSYVGDIINKISSRSTGAQSIFGIGATLIRRYSISETEDSRLYQYYSPYFQYYSSANGTRVPNSTATKLLDEHNGDPFEELTKNKSLISKFLKYGDVDHNNHLINTFIANKTHNNTDNLLEESYNREGKYLDGLKPMDQSLGAYATTGYDFFGYNRDPAYNPKELEDYRYVISASTDTKDSKFFNYNYDPNIVNTYDNSNIMKYGWGQEGLPGIDRSDPRMRTYREDKINMIKVRDFSKTVDASEKSNILSQDASEIYNQGSRDYIKFFITCAGLMFDKQYDSRGTLLDKNEIDIEPSVFGDTKEESDDTIDIQTEQSDPKHKSNLGYHAIVMRAFLNSVVENHNANWDSYGLIGRADPVYIYKSYDRNLTLSFDMHAFSRVEMQVIYEKINYLASMLAPVYKDKRMWGPLLRLTLGDLYWQVPGFITNLTYTFREDNWEIKNLYQESSDNDILELPMGVRVDMNYTIIGNYKPRKMGRIYDYVGDVYTEEPVVEEEKPEPVIYTFNIDFDDNVDTPKKSSEVINVTNYIIDQKLKNPKAKFDIEGHASPSGPDEYNYKLSFRRASNIKAGVVSNFKAGGSVSDANRTNQILASIAFGSDMRSVGYGEKSKGQRVVTVTMYKDGVLPSNPKWDNGTVGILTENQSVN